MITRKSSNEEPSERPPLVIDTIPFALLDQPLEYIFHDHVRQRAVTAALLHFAHDKKASRVEADLVTAYLTRDRPLHQADEEEDLFPLIRRRARPG